MGLDRREGELTLKEVVRSLESRSTCKQQGGTFYFLEVQQRTTTVHRNLPVGITQQRET